MGCERCVDNLPLAAPDGLDPPIVGVADTHIFSFVDCVQEGVVPKNNKERERERERDKRKVQC